MTPIASNTSSSPASHTAPARRSDAWRAHGAAPHALCAGGEFLSVRVGADDYGIDIQRVQDIRAYEPPTRMRHAPPCVQGVINLRGSIVPIVDLRLKLRCARADSNAFTAVLVLQLRGRLVGAVVDAVGDVVMLSRQQMQPVPAQTRAAFVTGIGTSTGSDAGERRLLLLDIDALIDSTVGSAACSTVSSTASAALGLPGH